MALRFILGPARSGKTALCLAEIKKRRGESPNGLFYLVPEQYAMQAERDFIAASGRKGVMDVHILSLSRLAHHVFAAGGSPAGVKILDDMGKNMLVRKALYESRRELKYFYNAADKAGFAEELAGLISEFKKYGVTPEKLSAPETENRLSEGLVNKLADIALILKKYAGFQAESLISNDDLLDILAEKLDGYEPVLGAEIWLDGFHGFTPQEYKVIAKLPLLCETVTVSLTYGENEELFAETRGTYERLTKICRDNNIEISETIIAGFRPKRAGALAFLSESLSMGGVSGIFPPVAQSGVFLYRAANLYDEIRLCASKILEGVREKGWRFRDAAVIMANPAAYSGILRAVFGQYGVPLFSDEKTLLASHRAAEFIAAMLETVYADKSYESVFRFLKTGLSGMSRSDIDVLENHVLEHGIKGGKWLKPWEDEVLNGLRESFLAMTAPLKFSRWAYHTVREYTEGVYSVLAGCRVPQTLSVSAEALTRRGENALALVEKRVWDGIAEVLDKVVELFGGEKMTALEYSKILAAGFSSLRLGTVPAALDAVLAGDFSRSILPGMKALFILGLNEGAFPSAESAEGPLNDMDREAISESLGLELKSGGLSKAYNELFLFYANVSKPSDELILSYAAGDLKGRELAPSEVIGDIKKLLGKALAERNAEDAEKTAKPDVFAEFIRNDAPRGGLFNYFMGDESYSGRLKKALAAKALAGKEAALPPGMAEKFFGGKIKTSVTKLEKYFACPFSYFAQYMLKAGERKIYEMKPIDIGNYFHLILEAFTKKLAEEGGGKISWRETPDAALMDMAGRSVDETLAAPGLFTENEQSLYFRQRLKSTALRSIEALNSHMKSGEFELKYSEAGFFETPEGGPENPLFGALEQKLSDGTRLIIEGRIDRIDMLSINGEDYVKVIDYKSGNKTFSLLEAYYGLSLQLLIYTHAFIENYKKAKSGEKARLVHPAAALYFLIKNPIIDLDKLRDDDIRAALMKEFQMKGGLVLGDMAVVGALDSSLARGEKKSAVIPISLVSSGESGFSKTSKQVSEEDFNAILSYSGRKAKEAGERILSGDIGVRPYKSESSSGCDYCLYKPMCRFDAKTGFERYNTHRPMGREEIIEAMRNG